MSSSYRSPSLNFYKHVRSNNNSCVLADLGCVGVREIGISFPLLSTLLPGLLLQHTLHASVYFVSCKHSDPSVLAAGKSRCWTEIVANTGTHLNPASEEQWNLLCHLHCCYTTQGRKHPSPLLFLKQLFHCPLTTPTKSHPHKFNYCDLFFAMLSALAKFAKVRFTQNIIALRYFEWCLFTIFLEILTVPEVQ